MSDLGSLPPHLPSDISPDIVRLLSDPATRSEILKEGRKRVSQNQLALYKPYSKQIEFHALGATKLERLLSAGNQFGKTYSGAAEMAFHLTGLYPDWWQGKLFNHPIRAWAGGPTAGTTREGIQTNLLGVAQAMGTGLIPAHLIKATTPLRGVADAIDTVTVEHVSGGVSTLTFKSYKQGRENWQAGTVHVVWFDEEPRDPELYIEGLARLTATKGIAYLTFTPLQGMISVAKDFFPQPKTPERSLTRMTVDECPHVTPADVEVIKRRYPEYTWPARLYGLPVLGSGAVLPIERSKFEVEPFEIPSHWARLVGMDFGWEHPTAAVRIAHDREADVVYVTDIYRVSKEPVLVHAGSLMGLFGKSVPVAWPHDGLHHEKGSGVPLADQYREHGLNMLAEKATHEENGGFLVEPGIMAMLDRMRGGRLKVFKHLEDWFAEHNSYIREEGKIRKVDDDLMDATRCAIMMLRCAETPKEMDMWKSSGSLTRRRKRLV